MASLTEQFTTETQSGIAATKSSSSFVVVLVLEKQFFPELMSYLKFASSEDSIYSSNDQIEDEDENEKSSLARST